MTINYDKLSNEKLAQLTSEGDTEAMVTLGLRHYRGAAQDHQYAAELFLRAEIMGSAKAAFCLGDCYLNGNGVPKNDAEAFRYFKKAADAGQPEAQFSTALFYQEGRVGEKNDLEAIKYYLLFIGNDRIHEVSPAPAMLMVNAAIDFIGNAESIPGIDQNTLDRIDLELDAAWNKYKKASKNQRGHTSGSAGFLHDLN